MKRARYVAQAKFIAAFRGWQHHVSGAGGPCKGDFGGETYEDNGPCLEGDWCAVAEDLWTTVESAFARMERP